MEITFTVMSYLKERDSDGKSRIAIEDRFTVKEDELLEMVKEKWKSDHEHSITDDRSYKFEVEEVRH